MKAILLAAVLAASLNISFAAEVPIRGLVSSKCIINTETPGVYGNPSPSVLSTSTVDGGVQPVIRYDVIEAGYYKATITTPTAFTSSPALADTATWTGTVSVSKVTSAGMSAYTTNKRVYGSTTEFDLTLPGTVWFSTSSTITYGYNKAFPAGEYKAVVLAECIAL